MCNDRNSSRKDDVAGKHGFADGTHLIGHNSKSEQRDNCGHSWTELALIKSELAHCILAVLPEPPFDFLLTNNVSQLHKTLYKYRLMKRHGCPVGAHKDCRTAV